MNAEAGRCAPRPLRAQPRLSSELMTPSVRLSPNYYSLAPSHRRLRDPAIASWMADTATTALPRSRRRTVVADNPLGSSPPDRKEVLHHRGRSGLTALGQPLPALCLRLLDGAGLPGHPVRALRGRCPRPLRERGGGAVGAGGDPGSSRGVRSGASSHEDPDRLLQGRRPAG